MESVPERLVGSSAVVSVDVVTVTYRSEGTVRGALEMLTGHEGVRVIVVDNASDDATLDVLGSLPVETIALDENGGFAHGCNVGAAAGTAPYVLFLNPDARIEPGQPARARGGARGRALGPVWRAPDRRA